MSGVRYKLQDINNPLPPGAFFVSLNRSDVKALIPTHHITWRSIYVDGSRYNDAGYFAIPFTPQEKEIYDVNEKYQHTLDRCKDVNNKETMELLQKLPVLLQRIQELGPMPNVDPTAPKTIRCLE